MAALRFLSLTSLLSLSLTTLFRATLLARKCWHLLRAWRDFRYRTVRIFIVESISHRGSNPLELTSGFLIKRGTVLFLVAAYVDRTFGGNISSYC
jgi:hypothetical protein